MEEEPTEEDLVAFAERLLATLDENLRAPEVLREAVTEQRELWCELYRIAKRRGTPFE